MPSCGCATNADNFVLNMKFLMKIWFIQLKLIGIFWARGGLLTQVGIMNGNRFIGLQHWQKTFNCINLLMTIAFYCYNWAGKVTVIAFMILLPKNRDTCRDRIRLWSRDCCRLPQHCCTPARKLQVALILTFSCCCSCCCCSFQR